MKNLTFYGITYSHVQMANFIQIHLTHVSIVMEAVELIEHINLVVFLDQTESTLISTQCHELQHETLLKSL